MHRMIRETDMLDFVGHHSLTEWGGESEGLVRAVSQKVGLSSREARGLLELVTDTRDERGVALTKVLQFVAGDNEPSPPPPPPPPPGGPPMPPI